MMRTEPLAMLDPTAETTLVLRDRVPPPADLEGSTVGLLCISKKRSDEFLDQVEKRLAEGGVSVLRFAKPSHSKPAPQSVVQDIVERCEVVVEALAD